MAQPYPEEQGGGKRLALADACERRDGTDRTDTAMADAETATLPTGASPWLGERIGAHEVVKAYRVGSRRTGVWEIISAEGRFYLKANRRRVRWATETYCYRTWISAFEPYAPRLLDTHEEEGCYWLLISAVEGVPLRELRLEPSQAVPAYRRAGELCRRLHSLPCGSWWGVMDENGRPVDNAGHPLSPPPTDPAAYYRQMLEQSIASAAQARALSQEDEATARAVLDSLPHLSFGPPVPASFDYTPGNWIVDTSGQLQAVIDFENMVWGLPADPFVRLMVDYFPQDPLLEEAFWDGYGGRPPVEVFAQARIGLLLYGLLYGGLAAASGKASQTQRARSAFGLCRAI